MVDALGPNVDPPLPWSFGLDPSPYDLGFGGMLYLDPNEMSGRSYFCTCPQTILLSGKENRICTLFTHR